MKLALSAVVVASLLSSLSAGAQSSSQATAGTGAPSAVAPSAATPLVTTPSLAAKVSVGTPPNTGNAIGPGIDAPGPVNEGSSNAIQTSGPDSTAPNTSSIGSTSGGAGH